MFTNQTEILRCLLFSNLLSSPSPCEVTHSCVQSLTLNTHTHVWKHPYQRRWRTGTPRAGWRAAWGMKSPAQVCLILPQAKTLVFLNSWQHKYIVYGSCVTLPKQEVGCHVHWSRGLCTDKVWLTTHFYFVYFSFPGHYVWHILKRGMRKAINIKGLNWGKMKIKQVDIYFKIFIYFNWRLITLQYCSGFCHTLTWISHRCTCVPHPELPSHLLPIPSLRVIPVHQPWAPCLMPRIWTGDLFHIW